MRRGLRRGCFLGWGAIACQVLRIVGFGGGSFGFGLGGDGFRARRGGDAFSRSELGLGCGLCDGLRPQFSAGRRAWLAVLGIRRRTLRIDRHACERLRGLWRCGFRDASLASQGDRPRVGTVKVIGGDFRLGAGLRRQQQKCAEAKHRQAKFQCDKGLHDDPRFPTGTFLQGPINERTCSVVQG